jgi:2,3-bisphosphoglycerate-independent phosphoglycerate mutase
MVLGFALAPVLHRFMGSTGALDAVAIGCLVGAALAAAALLGRHAPQAEATGRGALEGVSAVNQTASSG